MSDNTDSTNRIAVWDIWVRLFHWSLAVSVGLSLFSGKTGTWFFDWHRLLGEVILGLIVFRLLWGVLGSSNARLTSLFRSPRSALRHLNDVLGRRVTAEAGHNAAGALAVAAMLFLLALQATTGLFIADEDEWVEGAFYGALNRDTTSLLYDIHQINSNLLLTLVAVHVVMILVYGLYARLNLISPMITGRMRLSAAAMNARPTLQRWWIGAILAMASAVGVGVLVGWFGQG